MTDQEAQEIEELQGIARDAIGVCAALVEDADNRPCVYSVIDSMLIHRARDCVRRAMGDSADDWPNAREPK
jgi:hypothetical protein